MNKNICNNSLKVLTCTVSLLLITACTSGNSDKWPVMQADNLWQELEKSQKEDVVLYEKTSSPENQLLEPPFFTEPPTLLDIQNALQEIQRDLPSHEEKIALALEQFENAEDAQKGRYWRGVEIEKSRLNDIVVALRDIEYQISQNSDAQNEMNLTTALLERAVKLMPNKPDYLTEDMLGN